MDTGQIITFIFTAIFLLVIISYYILLFIKKNPHESSDSDVNIENLKVTIIVPAHNEEEHISECLHAIIAAKNVHKIIVVDDGSSDNTYSIAQKFNSNKNNVSILVLRTNHLGKALAINKALENCETEIFGIVDADSIIDKQSVYNALKYFVDNKVGAVCSVVKVKNHNSILGVWLNIEQLYNSLIRSLFAKININIVTPGPLSMYRRDAVKEIGGFSHKGLSEDVDIAIRLLKNNWHVEMSESSISETYMPTSFNGFWKQRTRFARGWINIFKKHLRINKSISQIYSLPLMLFFYLQAVIMGAINLINISTGYYTYFYSKGVYFSLSVGQFFLDWFSIIGIVKWTINIILGTTPLTALAAIGILTALMSYPIYFIAMIRYDKLRFTHLLGLFFIFPYWLLIMLVYTLHVKEIFISKQVNRWEKIK